MAHKNNEKEHIESESIDWKEILSDLNVSNFTVEPANDKEEFNESEALFEEAKQSYNKVDDKLLEFIDNFVRNQNAASKQKKSLKQVFFIITMVLFSLIVLTPIIILVVMLCFGVNNYTAIFGTIFASVGEVLTTVIVLPRIVAEYLFNKEEENANIKIVELMQNYSNTIHGYEQVK